MKSFVFSKLALLAVATLSMADDNHSGNDANTGATTITVIPSTGPVLTTSQTGCPTVTATRELCTTCGVPACLGLSTVTQSCGCPTPIPTVYLDFPCASNCAGIWCSTSYDIVTGACSGPGVTLPTPAPNGTLSTRKPTSSSSAVQVNAAGRMALPRWGFW
ncbi:hypothetical protein B0T25DRAFT_535984 [Lasiosphaeria hispida]|uniref:Uncharacterized protein n=1 Tax=Lasiosphaeria hispida TaxID=260671 RepID=A0AAJ0HSE8_9PEZI|nr:hypothetical protein B0T25DRAFT_535984 [Lasiosphaeria hispida]